MHNHTTKKLVLLALFSAIIAILTFIPYTGYITYGVLSITTIHIPVIIGCILLGPRGGMALGFVWGLTSLLKALTVASALEVALFLNPLISVLPRILVGLAVGLLAWMLLKTIKKRSIVYVVCAIVGTLLNTVLVLSAISMFGGATMLSLNQSVAQIITVILSLNGLVELFAAVIVVPIVSGTLYKVTLHQ